MDKHLPYGLACRLHSLLSVLKTFLPCLGKNIDSAVQHLTMLLIGYHDIYSSIKLVNYCWVLPLIGRRSWVDVTFIVRFNLSATVSVLCLSCGWVGVGSNNPIKCLLSSWLNLPTETELGNKCCTAVLGIRQSLVEYIFEEV